MDPNEIVIEEVQRHRMSMVRYLLGNAFVAWAIEKKKLALPPQDYSPRLPPLRSSGNFYASR